MAAGKDSGNCEFKRECFEPITVSFPRQSGRPVLPMPTGQLPGWGRPGMGVEEERMEEGGETWKWEGEEGRKEAREGGGKYVESFFPHVRNASHLRSRVRKSLAPHVLASHSLLMYVQVTHMHIRVTPSCTYSTRLNLLLNGCYSNANQSEELSHARGLSLISMCRRHSAPYVRCHLVPCAGRLPCFR